MVNEAGALHARVIKEEIFPGSVMTGQIAGMVTKVEKVSDIMTRIVDNVDTVMNGINVQLK